MSGVLEEKDSIFISFTTYLILTYLFLRRLVLYLKDKAQGDDLSLLAGNLSTLHWFLRKRAGGTITVLFSRNKVI